MYKISFEAQKVVPKKMFGLKAAKVKWVANVTESVALLLNGNKNFSDSVNFSNYMNFIKNLISSIDTIIMVALKALHIPNFTPWVDLAS